MQSFAEARFRLDSKRSMAMSDQIGLRQTKPSFSLVVRDYTTDGDDVCPVSSIAAPGRGSSP